MGKILERDWTPEEIEMLSEPFIGEPVNVGAWRPSSERSAEKRKPEESAFNPPPMKPRDGR